jgi:hypothetical protein
MVFSFDPPGGTHLQELPQTHAIVKGSTHAATGIVHSSVNVRDPLKHAYLIAVNVTENRPVAKHELPPLEASPVRGGCSQLAFLRIRVRG